MPKPKNEPWSIEKRKQITAAQIKARYYKIEDFVDELNKLGLHMNYQAYLRRERGETPCDPDEFWYYMKLLKINEKDVLDLYSRKPAFFNNFECCEALEEAV